MLVEIESTAAAIFNMIRFAAIGCSLQFTMLTVAAGLFFIGYYYRGWPEKITSILARVFLVASPTPALAAMQWTLRAAPPSMHEWMQVGLSLVLLGASMAIAAYGYWRFYMPFLRQHPAYRERRR